VTARGTALEVSRVAYSYGGAFALDDVSCTVGRGRFCALLGANGAGKSTLFGLITHLFESRDGTISINGHDIRLEAERALAGLGVVFQQPTLDLDLTVVQNLRYFAALHGLSGGAAAARIDTELARFDLADKRTQRVRTLSGGFRRRVEVARALLHRPALLLLDEPTVGLDVPTRQRIVDHAHALARDDGIGVLWATHLIDEIAATDDVVVMHEGRVRAAGGVSEILAAAGAATLRQAFDHLTAKAPPAAADGGGR
jgi:ABC-2 type transport system ATP-binding protein